jgi:hypothetical protein
MTREFHYIRQADGREELYDMTRDTTEQVNAISRIEAGMKTAGNSEPVE